jgi:hypothetical protein
VVTGGNTHHFVVRVEYVISVASVWLPIVNKLFHHDFDSLVIPIYYIFSLIVVCHTKAGDPSPGRAAISSYVPFFSFFAVVSAMVTRSQCQTILPHQGPQRLLSLKQFDCFLPSGRSLFSHDVGLVFVYDGVSFKPHQLVGQIAHKL